MKQKVIKMMQLEKEAIIKETYQNDYRLWFAIQNGKEETFLQDIKEYMRTYDDIGAQETLVYKITQTEVRELLKNLLSEGRITVKQPSPLEAVKQHGELLFEIPETEWNEEMVKTAIKQNKAVYDKLPMDVQRAYFPYFASIYPKAANIADMDGKTILEAVTAFPVVFESLSKEQVTAQLLYEYLRQCVKGGYKPGFSYYWSNIPDELKDKTYYQGKAMMNPYYLRECPPQYKSSQLIKYCMDDPNNTFTAAVSILENVAEEDLTEEQALTCCIRHFLGVSKLPKKYRNDAFYKKLMDNGQYEFIKYVDLTTISVDLLSKALANVRSQFWFCQDKIPKNIWTENNILLYAKVSNMFYQHVPAGSLTKEACILNLRYHKSIESFPKKWFDADVVDIAMENSYGIMEKIPDAFKTKDFYEKHISNHNLYFKDIPEEYVTSDVIKSYLEAGKSIPFEKIPHELITKELIAGLKNSCPHYHFTQSHQTPEITKWIYELIRDTEGLEQMYKYFYLLPHITADMVSELLSVYPPKRMANSLNKYSLSEEICDLLYAADPDCIIHMPESIREQFRNNVPNVPKKEKKLVETPTVKTNIEVKEDMGDITATFVQLSLFDYLTA